MQVMSKRERLLLFFAKLEGATPAHDFDSAFDLLSRTLNRIEDKYSGVAYNPSAYLADGRIYPPLDKMDEKYIDRTRSRMWLTCFKHVQHYTFISASGAILITDRSMRVFLSKAGSDGEEIRQ